MTVNNFIVIDTGSIRCKAGSKLDEHVQTVIYSEIVKKVLDHTRVEKGGENYFIYDLNLEENFKLKRLHEMPIKKGIYKNLQNRIQ